ncbi:putative TIR domain, winged helix-turn-helix DNA-binding domain-containing protein [Medicago truncatula]|uniref:Putative TIR domain, winged helix-turn-helix DNA-binding domain-containing protein n=1 Tax=Medicago truncatula TaxID=3880 RepID=A0A396HH80_MEDTR|nr:putative TIR domain, winged helix-turn-helix DNA-binding domain-containing protein [Medicago truncatula]
MAASQSSSSITNDGYEYDVFLNFRGPDTRSDFTGNLWNALHNRGIRTFRDDLEIYKGKNIEKSLFEAIEKSKAAIVVLSPSYATSSFCLDELCHILKCIEGRGGFVWPIFYEVDPSKVRWLEDTYGEAMAEHKKNNWYSEDKLKEWENALNQVANLSGTVYKWKKGDGYEYMFIDKIVRVVSTVIQPFSLSIPDYLVGLEDQKQDVLSLLNVDSDDKVYMVGIHGTGGIGKTTLAQAVYNSIVDQFDGSCYLEDVRGKTGNEGLIHLQNILLSKIFGENKIVVTSVNEGINELQVRLKKKKVLLLLDNVDKLDQLRNIVREPGWFGRGSRVMITTRDIDVLRRHGVERRHEVKMLNKDEAYDLLRWKTFQTNEVSPSFEDVFNRALTYISGLPLAIEIIGSHLFSKKTIEEWNSVLDQYKKVPNQEIFEILKVSYNDLVQDYKDVFLDIACFFKGDNLEYVKKILHAHYGDEKKDHINVLIEKSLIKISEFNDLSLHDLIEDMGKEIVRLESPYQPGERSRLWSVKDIVEVLEENTGTSKIGTIIMPWDIKKDNVVNWDGEAFKNMTKLRTLLIEGVKFSESPKHLPNSLRILEWYDYPSQYFPVDFLPRQLIICKLSSEFYRPREDFFKKYCRNMRILQFLHCNSLRSIPNMSGLQNLEELSFWRCPELITFDDSIVLLGKLKILNIINCGELKYIPLLKLASLKKLTLSNLYSIKSFSPMLNEALDKLQFLEVIWCPFLKYIPPLKLTSLKTLTLSHIDRIKSLSPMLDESLDKLKILMVEYCAKIQTIPSLKLPSLEELTLSNLST